MAFLARAVLIGGGAFGAYYHAFPMDVRQDCKASRKMVIGCVESIAVRRARFSKVALAELSQRW